MVLGYLLNKLNMFMTICFRTNRLIIMFLLLGISLPCGPEDLFVLQSTAQVSMPPCYLKLSRMMSPSYLYTSHYIHISIAIFPVFLPGESQGQRSPVGCCLWGHTESDTTEAT